MTRLAALLLPGLLAAPALAAASSCEFSEDREIALGLSGVATVRFEVNSHDLVLAGVDPGAVAMTARACASDADYLPQLVVDQRRSGDVLVVRIERRGQSVGIFLRPTYANLAVDARLPAGLAYEIDVGSGDARASGVASLRASVGSGDLEATGIAGALSVAVGSGDVEADGAGSLDVRSVGSGDFEARRIRGDARVGDVGSGDLTIDEVQGSVEIDEIGSGDADISRVGGSVRIGRVNSGDARVTDVAGDLVVHSIGSGDVSQRGVRGRVDVPRD